MPGDGDGLVFAADVFGYDAGVNGLGGERNGKEEVSLREPVSAEVSGVDDACDFFAAGNLFYLDVVGFGFEDEAVGSLPMLFAGRVMVWPFHSVVRVLPSAESLPRMRLG